MTYARRNMSVPADRDPRERGLRPLNSGVRQSREAGMKKLFLVALLSHFSICLPIAASSLVHTDLATLEAVRVVAVTGSLGFEPIEELDRDILKVKIEKTVPNILRRFGLSTSDEAPATLYVIIDKSDSPVLREWLAVSVRVELREPVSPERKIVWVSREPFFAATWDGDAVDLVARADATSETMELVRILTEQFAGNVKEARGYCKREGLWQPN